MPSGPRKYRAISEPASRWNTSAERTRETTIPVSRSRSSSSVSTAALSSEYDEPGTPSTGQPSFTGVSRASPAYGAGE
ncbi:Uncharacterised protein [Mycobacteroides abscessus]|nr:Uncharacterised protein [Mycobacteroides abscessus]